MVPIRATAGGAPSARSRAAPPATAATRNAPTAPTASASARANARVRPAGRAVRGARGGGRARAALLGRRGCNTSHKRVPGSQPLLPSTPAAAACADPMCRFCDDDVKQCTSCQVMAGSAERQGDDGGCTASRGACVTPLPYWLSVWACSCINWRRQPLPLNVPLNATHQLPPPPLFARTASSLTARRASARRAPSPTALSATRRAPAVRGARTASSCGRARRAHRPSAWQ